MKIVLLIDEVMEMQAWLRVCELRGWNPYDYDEGRLVSGTELTFTVEEIAELGLSLDVARLALEARR